jgi:hypothetical protein
MLDIPERRSLSAQPAAEPLVSVRFRAAGLSQISSRWSRSDFEPRQAMQGFPPRNSSGRVNAQMILVGERPENFLLCELPRDGQPCRRTRLTRNVRCLRRASGSVGSRMDEERRARGGLEHAGNSPRRLLLPAYGQWRNLGESGLVVVEVIPPHSMPALCKGLSRVHSIR